MQCCSHTVLTENRKSAVQSLVQEKKQRGIIKWRPEHVTVQPHWKSRYRKRTPKTTERIAETSCCFFFLIATCF
ncbi:uncharacterized [Tachysurus ichikawai]